MKLKFKLMIAFAVYALLMFFVVGCKNSPSTIDTAQNNQTVLDKGLTISNAQYQAEIENYKLEVELMHIENDSLMANFKAELKAEFKEGNPYYRRQITDIEHANMNLKNRLQNFEATGKKDWENFKDSLDIDMNELKRQHKNLTVKKA